MKKILLIIPCLIILLIVIPLVHSALDGNKSHISSRMYIDTVVLPIFYNWNSEFIFSKLDKKAKKYFKIEDLNDLPNQIDKNFGKIIRYDVEFASIKYHYSISDLYSVKAHYKIQASFSKTPAMINVLLIKNGKKWKIREFYVSKDHDL